MPIYKVLTPDEAAALDRTGEAPLSLADQRDGYVHLSTRAQLPGTLAKHFAPVRSVRMSAVRVLAVDPECLGAALRWEPAREGDLFPHLYGRLRAEHVSTGWVLGRGHDGEFRLPPELSA